MRLACGSPAQRFRGRRALEYWRSVDAALGARVAAAVGRVPGASGAEPPVGRPEAQPIGAE